MKKLLALLLVLALVFSFAACAAKDSDTAQTNDTTQTTDTDTTDDATDATDDTDDATDATDADDATDVADPVQPVDTTPTELIVFAAASMTETLDQIAALYKTVAPNVTLVFTYDSSGTLLTQIQSGAPADVFVSAAQKQMNTLDEESALLAGSRFDLVENKVALVVPSGNPANINSFDDAIAAASIALGNSDVPVGQYSEEIFTTLGVWDEVSAKATLGANVKEVTTWVGEAVVDCGIVYATDAFSAGLDIVADAPEGTLATPVVYPAAALAASENPEAAQAFLDYLKSPEAAAIFASVGFVPLG